MALSSSTHLSSISYHFRNPRNSIFPATHVSLSLMDDSSKPSGRISAASSPRARFVSRRKESVSVQQLERPLSNLHSRLSLFLFTISDHCRSSLTCDWVLLQFSIWVCLRVSTRCWMRRGLREWMIIPSDVLSTNSSFLHLRFALFC